MVFGATVFFALKALSDELTPPSGRVILEVGGTIEKTSDGTTAFFDLDQLENLGLAEILTESPWTDGMTTFQGVPLKTLADYLGARGDHVRLVALDDYTVTVPTSDFEVYQPILATRRNGDPMKIRDKGPIWVIYPWSEHPEIQNEENYAKAIWQVFQMTFE
jgi:hypothetical protein